MIRKDKGKSHADVHSNKQWTECIPCKCFRCVSEYHIIAKCPKLPKDNEKQLKRVRFSERVNHTLQK